MNSLIIEQQQQQQQKDYFPLIKILCFTVKYWQID
jgi:hypothetical protein